MDKGILTRLKALEARRPGSLVLLVMDMEGNTFECGIDEFEAHGDPYTTTLNGAEVYGREWGLVKIASGYNLSESYRLLDAIGKTFGSQLGASESAPVEAPATVEPETLEEAPIEAAPKPPTPTRKGVWPKGW